MLISCRMEGNDALRTSSVAASNCKSPPFLSPTRKERPSPKDVCLLNRMVVATVAAACFPAAFRMTPDPDLHNSSPVVLPIRDIMVGAVEFDYKTFEQRALAAIKSDSWDFVKSSIKYAVDKGELDPLASRLITEESVNALVDLVMGRSDMKEALKNAYNYLANSVVKEMNDEAEKAKQLAAWAESQPFEPSDPIKEESVEALMPSELPPGVEYDDSDTYEPIFDPSIDPDTVDDDGNSSTKG